MMNRIFLFIFLMLAAALGVQAQESVRKERRAIVAGNQAYEQKNYSDALTYYKKALSENPSSLPAQFNLALAKLMIASSLDPAKQKEREELLSQASQGMTAVAQHVKDNPSLASRANYNLGNVSYNAENYQEAIDFYKQALRLDPGNNSARKNLRLAQLKKPKEDKKDDKKNKDQDKDKDKKDNKDKPQPQNQDKNNQDKDKDKQNQDQKPQPQQPQQQKGMSKQAADRILKHNSDKEKQTMRKAMYGQPQKNSTGARKKW